MSPKRPAAPESRRRPEAPRRGRPRPYRRPELEEYGSLKELTRSFQFDNPGDVLATSYGQ